MIKVSILGTGNLAYQLFNALERVTAVTVVEGIGRHLDTISFYKEKGVVFTNASSLLETDIFIIAVADTAIEEVSKPLASLNKLIVHTSGSVAMELILGERKGVFYPLQTFSKERKADFSNIPICIETNNKKDLELLKKVANLLSSKLVAMNSIKRKELHIAAVFANNFSNHLFYLTEQICKSNELPFSLLSPLIEETVSKMKDLGPFHAQTGPARRKDSTTMQHHINHLPSKEIQKMYTLLSNSIQETYGKEL